MSKTDVITRKDMKEPDKFQVAASQAASWTVGRRRPVVAAGAAAARPRLRRCSRRLQAQRQKEAGAAALALLGAMGGDIPRCRCPGRPGRSTPPRRRASRRSWPRRTGRRPPTGHRPRWRSPQLALADAHYKLRAYDAAADAYQKSSPPRPRTTRSASARSRGSGWWPRPRAISAGAVAAYERLGQEAPKFADRAVSSARACSSGRRPPRRRSSWPPSPSATRSRRSRRRPRSGWPGSVASR